MRLSEIYPEEGQVQRIYCDRCHQHTILSYTTFDETIEDVHIIIKGLPVLVCVRCKTRYLPNRSRGAIIYAFEQATKNKQGTVKITRKKTTENFGLTGVPFIYDSDDYYYIPGLIREHDPGYLTPVFFNSEVLLKFDNSPEYRITFASKTYGDIRRSDDYSIPFGINQNRKVIMWLGDVATLPTNEQYYLRSENVESDHMIGSEFYDGQIECIFTDLSPEDELMKARSEFHECAFKTFGRRLTHLDTETLSLIEQLKPPVVQTEKEIRHILDLLNKINVESLNVGVIGELLQERGVAQERLGSLKKLQKLYEFEYPSRNISDAISPLFILYDLRVGYSHLTSKRKRDEILASTCERLGLKAGATGFDEIYTRLVASLTQCYSQLTEVNEREHSNGSSNSLH